MATLDTLQDAVNVLTTSTTTLVTEVQTKKAVLDAAVDDAQDAQTAAQAARDTANLHKLAAETAATTATSIASSLAGFDLESIAETKAVTAVDVFVYDTSRDSDGGAWRKRTQHTSWYSETLNTATRGARREFPAVAVIVAEAAKVTIYDGDDPSLPMWMVFNTANNLLVRATTVSSIAMQNGVLAVGSSNSGFSRLDFISEQCLVKTTAGYAFPVQSISFRNTGQSIALDGSTGLVNALVNDVAMTVLPNAPIDPATGLPVPVIAVATEGGVSVIKDDGTVVDSADTVSIRAVAFDKDYKLLYGILSGNQRVKITSTYDADGFNQDGVNYSTIMGNATGFYGIRESLPISGGDIAMESTTAGFSLHHPVPTNEASGLFANTTSSYNTGWMNGDIKGAFLSDTDDTDLVASGELVTNGTFDTDVSGWTAVNATLSVVSNKLQVSSNAAGVAYASQTLSGLTVGQTYTITATAQRTSGTHNAYVTVYTGTQTFVANAVVTGGTEATGTLTFVATQTSMIVRLQILTPTVSGETAVFDNISVKLADADRSVNNKGLIVNGTVTRTPVATGADLVAYSGFSSSNYLQQPYNSGLDFGTGDFCVMGWVRVTDGVLSRTVLSRRGSNNALQVIFDLSDDKLKLAISNNSFSSSDTVSSNALPISQWVYFCGVRSGSTLLFYQNGSLTGATAITNATGSLSEADATLEVGHRQDNVIPFTNGSIALLRISATAPTASQIAKIYNDEKFLFQDNAQATLYGASDAVTALAHDPVTDLLHVGTSAGRSVFSGLRRVSNTTTAVGTAISASNGLVAEE